MRPRHIINDRVRYIYEEMKINTEFDIDNSLPYDRSNPPAYLHNTHQLHTTHSLHNHRHRRPTQTSLSKYLPIAFQERVGTNDENTNEEWGESYRMKHNNTMQYKYRLF